MTVKSLKQYVEEAEAVLVARSRPVIESISSSQKSMIYELKRSCESEGILNNFEYVGRRGSEPAYAVFEVSDRDKFDGLVPKELSEFLRAR